MEDLEPFLFRPTFTHESWSWIYEACAPDTDAVTSVVQKSLSNHNSLTSDSITDPFVNPINSKVSPISNAHEPETPPAKRLRHEISYGKVTKRKPRVPKKSRTTFIAADPANFRQMVQQVTGVKFGNSQLAVVPLLNTEPQRAGSHLQVLPTLDTSTFLLDRLPQQVAIGPSSVSHGGPDTGLEFDTFSSFPTLESWKVT